MTAVCVLAALVSASILGITPAAAAVPVQGLDVSDHQTSINWITVHSSGAQFAYVKATEGTTFTNARFTSEYNGSYRAGLIRGAYHFARPNTSGGAAQHRVGAGGGPLARLGVTCRAFSRRCRAPIPSPQSSIPRRPCRRQ